MALSVAIGGLAIGAAGTATSVIGASESAKAQKGVIAQQQQAQAIQKQQQDLEAQRRQMELVRQNNRARSLALSNASASGAQFSSGLQGGYGQIAGDTNRNELALSQNAALGNQLFGVNQTIDSYRSQGASAAELSAFGGGLHSLGGAIVSSVGPLNRLTNGFSFGGGSSYVSPEWGDVR